jgi:hypothetical protein
MTSHFIEEAFPVTSGCFLIVISCEILSLFEYAFPSLAERMLWTPIPKKEGVMIWNLMFTYITLKNWPFIKKLLRVIYLNIFNIKY